MSKNKDNEGGRGADKSERYLEKKKILLLNYMSWIEKRKFWLGQLLDGGILSRIVNTCGGKCGEFSFDMLNMRWIWGHPDGDQQNLWRSGLKIRTWESSLSIHASVSFSEFHHVMFPPSSFLSQSPSPFPFLLFSLLFLGDFVHCL